jgi:Gluconolactonase
MDITLVHDGRAMLAETPAYMESENSLMWTNLNDGEVHILNLDTKKDRCIKIHKRVGSAIPSEDGKSALCAAEGGIFRLCLESEKLTLFVAIEPERKEYRMNDARCDARGRIFCSTTATCFGEPEYTPDMVGNFYRVDTDGSVKLLVAGIQQYNGIAFNEGDTKMFVTDTYLGKIYSFDYDVETGDIQNQHILANIPDTFGGPDGIAIDLEGRLYVGHWGGRVSIWDSFTGKLLEDARLPYSNVTCPGFGGNLHELYLTTARLHLSEEQLKKEAAAGGIFKTCISGKGKRHYYCKNF